MVPPWDLDLQLRLLEGSRDPAAAAPPSSLEALQKPPIPLWASAIRVRENKQRTDCLSVSSIFAASDPCRGSPTPRACWFWPASPCRWGCSARTRTRRSSAASSSSYPCVSRWWATGWPGNCPPKEEVLLPIHPSDQRKLFGSVPVVNYIRQYICVLFIYLLHAWHL
jgi:hypothetical protein